MAPKTRVTRALCGKNISVPETKATDKNKTSRRLPNPALVTPYRSLASGGQKKKQVTRSVKAGMCFPIGQIGRYLKEGRYSQCIGFGAPVFLAVVLEYLTTEVLELAGQDTKECKKTCIIPMHVILVIMRDEELTKPLDGVTISHGGVLPNIHSLFLGESSTADAAKSPATDATKSP